MKREQIVVSNHGTLPSVLTQTNGQHLTTLPRTIAALELGDVLLLLYFLVFVRQYFWVLDNNFLAWILTGLVTLIAWGVYLSTRQSSATKFGRSLWLLVGLPLLFAFLLRAAFPDHSYDVLNYHLLNTERSLRGPLFQPSDFFPSVPFNPVGDMITGISRLLLGYRLGTVINLLVLLWLAQITDKILHHFISNRWVRSGSVLLIMLTENLLFEISTYLVDLLILPLLLQATLLTIEIDESDNPRISCVQVSLLLGASAALKFTTLAVALPLGAICGYKLLLGPRKVSLMQLTGFFPLFLAAFLAPLAAFTAYIYRLTGNPLFPVANPYFKSPYWPTHGGWDNRWGPHTIFETIVWPIMIWFKPERHSELAVYSGRLSFGFVVALLGLLLVWRNTRARILCLVLIVSSLLWSKSALGYSRYGLYQDLLAGIIIVVVAAIVITKSKWQKISWPVAVASLLGVVLAIQSFVACRYFLDKEWGERTTLVAHPDIYAQEAKLMLRDRSLANFLTEEQRAQFEKVQVWFETDAKTSGFEVLLNSHAPIIALRQPEFFATQSAWREFISKVEATTRQGMYSLCLSGDLQAAKKVIIERGLEVGESVDVPLPFFSAREPIGIMLVEVRFPQEGSAREQFEAAWMKSAFTATDYREQILAVNPPTTMHVGEKAEILFKVKNLGSMTWPAVGTRDFKYQVNLGNHWIINDLISEDSRAVMNGDLPPGAETDIKMTVKAPQTPGNYLLEIDLVHEGVTWFKEQGASPLSLHVNVQP